jgi:Zn-dependent protease with chaperone function
MLRRYFVIQPNLQRARAWLCAVLLLSVGMLLTSCATTPKRQWNADSIASDSHQAVNLNDEKGSTVRQVQTVEIRNYVEIGKSLEAASGIDAQMQLVDDPAVNAFAGYAENQRVVGVNFGLLDIVKPTKDEFAALIGHELAHFALHHYESNQRRHAALNVVSFIAGTALGLAGVPLGGTLTDLAVQVIDTKFSREQEEAADKLGFEYTQKAGFSGYGAVTLQEKLQAASSTVAIPFLSSHPSGAERIAYLRKLTKADLANSSLVGTAPTNNPSSRNSTAPVNSVFININSAASTPQTVTPPSVVNMVTDYSLSLPQDVRQTQVLVSGVLLKDGVQLMDFKNEPATKTAGGYTIKLPINIPVGALPGTYVVRHTIRAGTTYGTAESKFIVRAE